MVAKVAGYVLGDRLGSGGRGVVYRALRQPSGTAVALAGDCGVPGALARGRAAVLQRAAAIPDPATRAAFLERIGAHARLLARAERLLGG